MDAAEFKQLFLPCHPKLYRMAFRLTGNGQEAEDMVQEAYLRLWSKRNELSHIENPDGFCLTLLRNICLDHLRRKYVEEADAPPEELPIASGEDLEHELEVRDEAVHLMELIDRLPPPQRRVIKMRDVADMSFEEIEQSTGLSPGNIRLLLSRARKKIREQYKLLLN
jgi:RNA polymerase sigma-70 factor (ECF subfamily)